MEYAYQPKKRSYSAKQPEKTAAVAPPRTARARITGVNASWKDLANVCRNVRGWDADSALEFLDAASRMEKAILFTRHNHGKGHRRELGGKKGGWPVKSVKIVLGVLQNAVANANKLGLSHAKIAHIIANKQNTLPRMSPKGRRIVHNYETAFVEIVLEEVQEKPEDRKGSAKKAEAKTNTPKIEAKKAEVKPEPKKEAAKAVSSPSQAKS